MLPCNHPAADEAAALRIIPSPRGWAAFPCLSSPPPPGWEAGAPPTPTNTSPTILPPRAQASQWWPLLLTLLVERSPSPSLGSAGLAKRLLLPSHTLQGTAGEDVRDGYRGQGRVEGAVQPHDQASCCAAHRPWSTNTQEHGRPSCPLSSLQSPCQCAAYLQGAGGPGALHLLSDLRPHPATAVRQIWTGNPGGRTSSRQARVEQWPTFPRPPRSLLSCLVFGDWAVAAPQGTVASQSEPSSDCQTPVSKPQPDDATQHWFLGGPPGLITTRYTAVPQPKKTQHQGKGFCLSQKRTRTRKGPQTFPSVVSVSICVHS